MTFDEFFDAMQNSAIKAYVTVYGQGKWDSLSDKDKGKVVHTLVMNFAKAVLDCDRILHIKGVEI